jgi:hypothetical protein
MYVEKELSVGEPMGVMLVNVLATDPMSKLGNKTSENLKVHLLNNRRHSLLKNNWLHGKTGRLLSGDKSRTPLSAKMSGQPLSGQICPRTKISLTLIEKCEVPYTDNSMSLRTSSCIALYPTGARSGSCKFLVLKTMKIVVRDKWTALPTPQSIIDFVNGIAASGGRVAVRDPVFAVGAKHVSVPDLKDLVSSSEGHDPHLKGRSDAETHPGPIIENFDTPLLPPPEDISEKPPADTDDWKDEELPLSTLLPPSRPQRTRKPTFASGEYELHHASCDTSHMTPDKAVIAFGDSQ